MMAVEEMSEVKWIDMKVANSRIYHRDNFNNEP
jgi:hypothetical protein